MLLDPPSPPPCNASAPMIVSFRMPHSLLSSVLRTQHAPASPPAPAPVTTPQPRTSPTKAGSQGDAASPAPTCPVSSSSLASADGKPKKRTPRLKTTFKLAQPPPGWQKLHIRPKVLLQLHQVVADRRPKPVFEVIPYSFLAPVSTRRLARTFRIKDRLGAHDLLIVKAENYGNSDEARPEDERWASRDVVAIICPGKEEKTAAAKTEVLMDDGTSWEVACTPNGGYEFTYTDDHGLALRSRWVPRPSNSRPLTGSSATSASPIDDRKFTFSTISANSRRHPIIATMTRDRIDVLDSYTIPTAACPPTPGLPSSPLLTPLDPPNGDMDTFIESASENTPTTTDDALRRFIVASGIWVAFCENWSPAYSHAKTCTASAFCPVTAALGPAHPIRSVSMTTMKTPRSASPSSMVDENKRQSPRLLRNGIHLPQRNASLTNSTEISWGSSPIKIRPYRSLSTGTAELRRKLGSRKRYSLGLGTGALTETEEERQYKSSTTPQYANNNTPRSSSPEPSQTSPNITRSPQRSQSSPKNTPSPQRSQFSPKTTGLSSPSFEYPPPNHTTSFASSDSQAQPKQTPSVFNPITTTGLWDSGVHQKRGLKTRPMSKVTSQEKKKKAKSKEKNPKKRRNSRRMSEGVVHFFTAIFCRDKRAAEKA